MTYITNITTMKEEIIQGDCLIEMAKIPDKSIDMILADLPYGTTGNKWDFVISLPLLWIEYERIIKSNGVVVLTAQTPFDKVLGCSNILMLKYEWIYEKPMATGHLNSKKMPMKAHENILVFYKQFPTYNPQMVAGEPYKSMSGRPSSNYGKQHSVPSDNKGVRFPRSIVRFPLDKVKYHPTQKPLALFEYLIKTYTNEGDLVLDNCAGSGTTGVACRNLGRNFILIEKEAEYIEIINKRLAPPVT